MAKKDGEALHTVADALQRADELCAEAETRLQTAQDIYRQLLERLPESHDRGQVARQAWETDRRLQAAPLYFSEAGQDRFLDEQVFEGKRNGVFIEIGGYDGVTGSTCLFFEAFRDWTGIVVEPVARHAQAAAKIRSSPCIEVAIGPEDGNADLIHITNGYAQMSGLVGSYNEDILKAVRENPSHREEILRVPTRRLDSLIREHGLQHIDYCSMDVEGAELAILSSFPFDEFNISVWTIENATGSGEIRQVMEANGYDLLTTLGIDEVYKRANVSR